MYKCDSSVWRIGFWNVLVRHWPSGWKPSGLDRAGGQSASLGFSNCCSVGNGKEWGLLGWLLIVWIIPENSLRLAPVRFCFHRFFFFNGSYDSIWGNQLVQGSVASLCLPHHALLRLRHLDEGWFFVEWWGCLRQSSRANMCKKKQDSMPTFFNYIYKWFEGKPCWHFVDPKCRKHPNGDVSWADLSSENWDSTETTNLRRYIWILYNI